MLILIVSKYAVIVAETMLKKAQDIIFYIYKCIVFTGLDKNRVI